MSNCRTYGKSPYKVALLHGGPGAAGSLKELAQMVGSGLFDANYAKNMMETRISRLSENKQIQLKN